MKISKNAVKKSVQKADALLVMKEAFIRQVTTLKSKSVLWEANEFSTANGALYQMHAELYDTYNLMTGSTSESKEKRVLLKTLCDEVGYKFAKTTPHIVDMLVKFVFGYNEKNKRRLSTYARCIKICVTEPSVYCGADVVEHIEKCGGVEEVIRSLSKTSVNTAEEKRKVAKENFVGKAITATVQYDEVTENVTSLIGSYVVLVGQVTETGSIEVKHLCAEKAFGDRQRNFGSSVVNHALANMGSVINASEDTNKAANDAEVDSKNENSELLGAVA